jgi:hypothetical protein
MKMLSIFICLFSLTAWADHHEEKGGKTFEEKKAKMLENYDKRISKFNEGKSCVSSAKDEDGLKACHQKMKSHREEMKKAWKAKKMK